MPEETVQPETFKKEYQPVDSEGKPLGPKQVFEGESWQEVADKLADAHLHASAKIAELRTRIQPDPDSPIREFKPRELTADEKWKLKQQMDDPATMDQAFDTLLEARLGAKPEDARAILQENVQTKRQLTELFAAQEFAEANPEYLPSHANLQAMDKWFTDHKVGRTRKNLEMAWDDMKQSGLAVLRSVPEPEPITPEPAKETRPRGSTASALFRQHSSAGPAVQKVDASFAEEVRKMTSAQYKAALGDPTFRKKLAEMENTAVQR